jgi:hypothetical protein
MQGIDWRPDSRLGENPNNVNSANPGFPVLNSDNNAAYDGLNQYGDDALAGRKVVSVGGLNIDGKTNQTPLIPMRSLLFSCAETIAVMRELVTSRQACSNFLVPFSRMRLTVDGPRGGVCSFLIIFPERVELTR